MRFASQFVALFLTVASTAGPAASAERVIHRIVLDGPISPATVDYVRTAIDTAASVDSVALVVSLDTPGGLLAATQDIVKAMLGSHVPIIVYVAPSGASATSAGVFVTLSAHVAAMAPGTTIGAAHPVAEGGDDIGGDMRTKVENFAVSFVESIATRRGRNVEWAEKAVRESVSITETEAVELKVVDFVANDLATILERAQGLEVDVAGAARRLDFGPARDSAGTPRIVEIPLTLRQRVLEVVADPNVAYLLMMVGLLGLYVELSSPGAVLPGVAGVICLLLALLASQVLPISATGAILVIVGFAFLLAELFVPSFGVLGFGGLLALALGSLFLYTPESAIAVDRSVVAWTTVLFAAAMVSVVWLVLRDRRRPVSTGAEALLGARGKTLSSVHRTGRVRVRGESWNARSATPIERGRPVRIRRVDGLELLVEEEAGRNDP